jgi:hypothetical protein
MLKWILDKQLRSCDLHSTVIGQGPLTGFYEPGVGNYERKEFVHRLCKYQLPKQATGI